MYGNEVVDVDATLFSSERGSGNLGTGLSVMDCGQKIRLFNYIQD